MFERILFYHPPRVSLREDSNAISLALALVFAGVNTFGVACQTSCECGTAKASQHDHCLHGDGANGTSGLCGVDRPTYAASKELLLLASAFEWYAHVQGWRRISPYAAWNSDPYNIDSKVTWLDWDRLKHNQDIFRFFAKMIVFRRPIRRWVVPFSGAMISDGMESDLKWTHPMNRAPRLLSPR